MEIDRNKPARYYSMGRPYQWIKYQDRRSIVMTEIDPAKIVLAQPVREEEGAISYRSYRRCLRRRGLILLDVKILEVLIENQPLIPDSWLQTVGLEGKRGVIWFDGTIGTDWQDGDQIAFMAYRPEDGRWISASGFHGDTRDHSDFSACYQLE